MVTDCSKPNSCDSCPQKHHSLLHGAHSDRNRQAPRKPQSSQQEDGPKVEVPKVQAMSSANAVSSGESGDQDEDEIISLGVLSLSKSSTNLPGDLLSSMPS